MTLMLFDASNLYFRAWFASQNKELSAEGTPTGTLLVFMNSFSALIRQHKPDRVGVCWEGGKSAFRTAVRPTYKANRDHSDYSQAVYDGRELIKSALALCGIHQISRQGYEADDLIAGFWSTAKEPVQIVSNDKDFAQLAGLNPNGHPTTLLRLSSAGLGTEEWDEDRVRAHYGCTGRNLALLMSLMGDKADNLDGIPGIGPKRGLKIMQDSEFNTINVLNHPKVKDHAELVRSNLMLISLRAPLAGMDLRPLKDFSPVGPDHEDWPDLESFLKKYQLSYIRGKINEGRYWKLPENHFGA